MVALELDRLTKAWPAMKVEANLQVEAGSLLALAGPSGCGKSTVLRMVAGLCSPDSGRVRIGGTDVTSLPPQDRGVGMVFQDYALFPHMDVLSNVSYGLRIQGIRRKDRDAQSLAILEALGMGSFTRRRPHELSGGEKQRVALARTIAAKPRIVLFDEPLASLDGALRKHLRSEIREFQKKFGLTALYVTHDLEEALAMADKIAVMDQGTILQCSNPIDLWQKPANAKVARFLGSGPCLPILRFEATGGQLEAFTESGRFAFKAASLPSWVQSSMLSMETHSDKSVYQSPKAFVYFERTAAFPIQGSRDNQNQHAESCDSFSATCVRNDFAGDVVDCLLLADQDTISLRLPPDQAPSLGESRQFKVLAEKTKIISD